jgi:hypothetical protein
MTHSEQINELAAALAKAQGQIEGAKKDSINPHFKNRYADLASVWDACREALTTNGLSVVQSPSVMQSAENCEAEYGVTTMLLHSSGQWMRGTLYLKPTKNDPQGAGSALTYARRYALAAMVGIAPEDDDANAASQKPVVAAMPAGFQQWLHELMAVSEDGTEELQKFWKGSPVLFREFLTQTNNKQWESIKSKAATIK